MKEKIDTFLPEVYETYSEQWMCIRSEYDDTVLCNQYEVYSKALFNKMSVFDV